MNRIVGMKGRVGLCSAWEGVRKWKLFGFSGDLSILTSCSAGLSAISCSLSSFSFLVALSFLELTPSFLRFPSSLSNTVTMPQPPALTLLSSSSPAHPISTSPSYLHTQSQSPFRYINFDDQHSQSQYNEKDTPLTEIAPSSSSSSNPPYFGRPSSSHPHSPLRSSTAAPKSHHAHRSGRSQHHTSRAPSYSQLLHPSSSQSQQYIPFSHAHQHSYHRPRGLRIWNLLKSWLPIILYIFTSLVFVVAIAAYKTELFSRESNSLSLAVQS